VIYSWLIPPVSTLLCITAFPGSNSLTFSWFITGIHQPIWFVQQEDDHDTKRYQWLLPASAVVVNKMISIHQMLQCMNLSFILHGCAFLHSSEVDENTRKVRALYLMCYGKKSALAIIVFECQNSHRAKFLLTACLSIQGYFLHLCIVM
jgi:hypothetical protein